MGTVALFGLRRMRCRNQLIVRAAGLTLTAAWLLAMPSAARQAGELDATLTLRPRAVQGVAELEIAFINHASLVSRRVPVSDLVVRLKPAGEGRLATMLTLADGDRPGRGLVIFTAEIIVVAGGRILIEERARCQPWVSGASICRTECDGGTFAILRNVSGVRQTLTLRVGRIDASLEAGVRLGACRDGGGEDPSLQPRQGRATSELQLEADGL